MEQDTQAPDTQILEEFRNFMAKQRVSSPATFVPLQNHPLHRGVVDSSYVRPAPHEFPKMLYHISGQTKIVGSRAEQDGLGDKWCETPPPPVKDWRDKLNEVSTKSGFRVLNHHIVFLRENGVQVETLREAAEFLDTLDGAQQESFFLEAENSGVPTAHDTTQTEAPVEKKSAKRGK